MFAALFASSRVFITTKLRASPKAASKATACFSSVSKTSETVVRSLNSNLCLSIRYLTLLGNASLELASSFISCISDSKEDFLLCRDRNSSLISFCFSAKLSLFSRAVSSSDSSPSRSSVRASSLPSIIFCSPFRLSTSSLRSTISSSIRSRSPSVFSNRDSILILLV